MPVLPFFSDAEVVDFANAFLREHVERFRKDIKICLTRNKNKAHAYFPALIACICFADFLSGLYAGNLQRHGLQKLKIYAPKFMGAAYTSDRLDVLYECFRHKVAHLAQPFAVFDTKTKPDTFKGQARRLITWTVRARGRRPPIDIVAERRPKQILRGVTSWPVHGDHRAIVTVRSLATDIEEFVKR